MMGFCVRNIMYRFFIDQRIIFSNKMNIETETFVYWNTRFL